MGVDMRLTDEQIYRMWKDEMGKVLIGMEWAPAIVATVRKCLALAALPDEQKDYQDVERRGFEVSQPGELPR